MINIKVKNKIIMNGNTQVFYGPIPLVCPHCGTTIEPIQVGLNGWSHEKTLYYIVGFKGNCCNNPFNVTYLANSQSKLDTATPAEIVSIHPSAKPREFTELIKEKFTRFTELYNHAYYAEDSGFLALAGAGYRNALEVLVKDFAANILKEDRTNIAKKTLHDAIKAYVPGVDPTVAAHGIRLIGNNFTHWEQEVDLMDLETLHAFFEVVLSTINTKLLLNRLIEDNKVTEHQIGEK